MHWSVTWQWEWSPLVRSCLGWGKSRQIVQPSCVLLPLCKHSHQHWHHNNLELILYFHNFVWIVAKAALGKLRDGMEHIWAFLSAQIPSWTELNWTKFSPIFPFLTKLLGHFLVFCLVEQVTMPLMQVTKQVTMPLMQVTMPLMQVTKSLCHSHYAISVLCTTIQGWCSVPPLHATAHSQNTDCWWHQTFLSSHCRQTLWCVQQTKMPANITQTSYVQKNSSNKLKNWNKTLKGIYVKYCWIVWVSVSNLW